VAKLELTIHIHIYKGEALFDIFKLLSKLKEDKAVDHGVMGLEYVGD